MKNRRIIFLAACMCSVVFLSGCSTDSLMDKMMGTTTTVSSSASVDISKEDSDAVHVDANLEKPVFSVNPVESLQIPVGNTSGKLTCEAGITGEGTVTYQWYKNNVNSNGGGTPIEGATEVTYQVDTSAEGKDYYYVVATNTVGNTVSMATSTVTEVTVIPAGKWVQNENGWQYQDEADFLRKLSLFRSQPHRREQLSRCARESAESFSAETFSCRMERLYLDQIERHHHERKVSA